MILSFNMSWLSRYRAELMGIAAILIIFCHAPANEVQMPSALAMVLKLGGVGVDMFLFLSGIGLSYSLSKSSEGIRWLSKRYIRIMIPYLTFIIPLGIYSMFWKGWSMTDFLMQITTLSFWMTGRGMWFVSMIVVLYLFTPSLFRLLNSRHRYLWLAFMTMTCILIGWFHESDASIFRSFQFCIVRLPSFFLGLTVVREIREGKQVSVLWMSVVPLVLYVLLYFLNHRYNTNVTLFWLLMMPTLSISTLLVHYFQNKVLHKVCCFMGDISLESYCTNVSTSVMFPFVPYYLGAFGSIAVAYVVNRISKIIISKIN